jgi:hypothetical protein
MIYGNREQMIQIKIDADKEIDEYSHRCNKTRNIGIKVSDFFLNCYSD